MHEVQGHGVRYILSLPDRPVDICWRSNPSGFGLRLAQIGTESTNCCVGSFAGIPAKGAKDASVPLVQDQDRTAIRPRKTCFNPCSKGNEQKRQRRARIKSKEREIRGKSEKKKKRKAKKRNDRKSLSWKEAGRCDDRTTSSPRSL
ncbi:hypothetical protein BO70DRAFT_73356 [Aspergillus heteromorphus CBS 117.55]|uniref:Uncharacterized protein n=1 Tax=Aspergillus heteromorphus CBS 117.55 TaxID=1448321 RepID=A0A317VT66_9EURO|nr:uncharacterized protein BO70DRAFT_73356 [Aspergillus heteromorphus CBS 117.55]PWY77115.1 hypothetical protein BO70DRAFT_73356 [Aspergillus heteromorphus CBS 117.55]